MLSLRYLLPDVRSLPRAYWVLFSAAAIDRLGAFVVPYLALYLTGRRGLSVDTAGVVLSSYGVGGFIGTVAGGVLADRFGRKSVLVGASVFSAIALVHLGLARAPVHIAIAALLVGAAGSLSRPASAATVADVVPEQDRRRAYGLHYWVVNLGFAFAATLATLVADVSTAIVFGVDAASATLAALVLWRWLPETRPTTTSEAPRVTLWSYVERGGPLRDGALVVLMAASTLGATLFLQVFVALAVEMRADGLERLYGPVVAINGVLIVALQPLAIRLTTRFRATSVLVVGSLLTGAGFALHYPADSVPGHALAIVVWTIGEILLASTHPAIIARLAPPDRRATYQGCFQLSWSAAAAAPGVGAFVLSHGGPLFLWLGCLGVGALAAVLQASLRNNSRVVA